MTPYTGSQVILKPTKDKIDYAKAFASVDHNKLWKILKEMGIPDHLTCLLRNLQAGQEATVRTGHGTTDWLYNKAVYCHPAYLTSMQKDSPGKNTGVGCHFLLQCMKVKSESEVSQSCPTLRDPMDCSLPGSFVHGIFQARVLEWGAIAFSAMQSTS